MCQCGHTGTCILLYVHCTATSWPCLQMRQTRGISSHMPESLHRSKTDNGPRFSSCAAAAERTSLPCCAPVMLAVIWYCHFHESNCSKAALSSMKVTSPRPGAREQAQYNLHGLFEQHSRRDTGHCMMALQHVSYVSQDGRCSETSVLRVHEVSR
jgi:hypothetical protein